MFHSTHTFKKLAGLGLITAALFGCSGNETTKADTATATDTKTVAITAIVEHPALDAVRQGAIEELATAGFKEGENLTVNFQSAQGNQATAGQIAKQFAADNPNAIIAIATPSAQAVVAATSEIPVVFSAVTDPVEAKLVSKLEGSGANVTGASDALPLEPQVALIQEILPNVKNVGFVYSPGEVNSVVTLKALKAELAAKGINLVEAPAQKSSDIAMATQSLVGKVDVIYTSTDNNVINAYEALAQVAKEAKIPLISADPNTIERGAAVTLGVNYLDLGRETGKITARILKGEKAGDIPVYLAQSLELGVNAKNAADQGISIPKTVTDRASKVVQ
ncbi:ABC transporter substrate-binding protein [Moraxella nasovis]|uniref:ABC transporter substrate-binding protein n=1 Tax=Moraxella nasovis TaxID=2904121 RepID=UPI001F6130CF|nr:ABC transporter substrate-binding protein [Moraxella nasovis]UNU74265.1 ABC transporter substrate-binding protein [Moraxella nasovis]